MVQCQSAYAKYVIYRKDSLTQLFRYSFYLSIIFCFIKNDSQIDPPELTEVLNNFLKISDD